MKRNLLLSAILIAILVLGFVTCDNGSGTKAPTPPTIPTSVTYTSYDEEGAMYRLVISRPPSASVRSAFTPSAGDQFTLTRTLGGITQTATGTVSSISGTTFTLQQGASSFTLAVTTGGTIATITGEIAIAGGTMTAPSGDLVASAPSTNVTTLTFSDMQVYTSDDGTFTPFTESIAVTSYPPGGGGTGTITGGKLNFTIGTPDELWPFADKGIWGDGMNVSPANAQGRQLSLRSGYAILEYGDVERTGDTGWSERISFIYVDRDCTFTFPPRNESYNGVTQIRQATILQLKKGWNYVSTKDTFTSTTETKVITVVNRLPSSGRWVIWEYHWN